MARVQIKKNAKIPTFINIQTLPNTVHVHAFWKNLHTVTKHINKIIPYSAINKPANLPAENSVLKPDTNSDSASTKSKGARLASAKQIVTHSAATGRQYKLHHEDHPESESEKNLIPPLKNITATKVILRQIS